MRRMSRYLSLLGLVSFLTSVSVGLASASSAPPIIQPQIIAVSSASFPCASPGPCRVIATLTYNTGVGVAGNAVPAFTVEDRANEQACAVLAVTTAPPPTPVVQPPAPNALYLTMSCVVKSGDVML